MSVARICTLQLASGGNSSPPHEVGDHGRPERLERGVIAEEGGLVRRDRVDDLAVHLPERERLEARHELAHAARAEAVDDGEEA
jgi:hypothetical protein